MIKQIKFILFAIIILLFNCTEKAKETNPLVNIDYYSISFDKNDIIATGVMSPQRIPIGTFTNLPANMYAKTNWEFVGWSIISDGTIDYVDQEIYTMGNEDIVLYAKWEELPEIITDGVTNITASTATLNGRANPNGLDSVGWFRYSIINPGNADDASGSRVPTVGGASLGSGTVLVTYSENITGLASGQTYYYWAISANMSTTAFGEIKSFTLP